MAKKRGKQASSTPSSFGKRNDQDDTNDDSIDMDELHLLKNADLSNLSPKQADKVLKVLDELIITRIQGKEGSATNKDQADTIVEKGLNSCAESNPNSDIQQPKQADPSIIRPNMWQKPPRTHAPPSMSLGDSCIVYDHSKGSYMY
ncbi:hypothetical protein RIF29_15272 [Crotalaria pallida]|uniref:Uncharacterized protein n=1 Tax=Crotalaria pallida TaxID=3830 RepID=A0AAN9ICG2_CROPI